jgi:RNA polymerase sigma factor (TIGR02999 family)
MHDDRTPRNHGPGEAAAVGSDVLYDAAYAELKRIAHRQLRAIDANATICTTELVHEAYLKLGGSPDDAWEGRAHFFGSAARAMRQVLVDLARRRQAAKRGGGAQGVSLRDADAAVEVRIDELVALDAALNRLEAANGRLARVVELRFFGGLGMPEVARTLGVTTRTIERDWLKARLFLVRALEVSPG